MIRNESHRFSNLRNRLTRWTAVSAVVALIITACGPSSTPTPAATPTPVVTPRATIAATTQPTATVAVAPSATIPATTQPTATPGLTPRATSTSVPQPTPTAKPAGTPTQTIRRGGTLKMTVGAMANYDLHKATIVGPMYAYSGMVRDLGGPDLPDGEWKLTCDLCKSWKQTDPLTYIFDIRQGVRFAPDLGYKVSSFPGVNGRELTAADIAWSMNRQKEPDSVWRSQLDNAVKIEATDRYTVKITLRRPDVDFVQTQSVNRSSVAAHEIVEALGDLRKGPTVGTGPWVMSVGSLDQGFDFVRNPEYFETGADGKALPYLDGLKMLVILDRSTQLAALRTGQLKYLTLTPEEAKSFSKDNPSWNYNEWMTPCPCRGIDLNRNQAPLDNKDFVRALFYAWDPYAAMKSIDSGQGVFFGAVTSVPPSWMFELEPQVKPYVADLAKAKQLLEKSGVRTPVTLDWKVYDSILQPQGTALIQDMWSKIGVRLNITTGTGVEQVGTYAAGKWGAVHGAFLPAIMTTPTSRNLFVFNHSTGTIAHSYGINDPVLDKMIDDQAAEIDVAKRKAIVFKISTYMAENGYWRGGWAPAQIFTARPELHNYYPTVSFQPSLWVSRLWLDA